MYKTQLKLYKFAKFCTICIRSNNNKKKTEIIVRIIEFQAKMLQSAMILFYWNLSRGVLNTPETDNNVKCEM